MFDRKAYMKKYHKEHYHRKKEVERVKGWKKNNPQRVKELQKIALKNWREKNEHKIRAETKAYKNIPIPKNQLCEICKKNIATERHHEDYSKPLEVMFVCNKCHNRIHRGYKNGDF